MSKRISLQVAAEVDKMAEDGAIIIEEINNKGLITLNRPKALNALTLPMSMEINLILEKWESYKDLVIVRGIGDKAFCAGGDLKSHASLLQDSTGEKILRGFIRENYATHLIVGTYKIPYIALLNGITMGSGAGLGMHGKFSVATEKTVFAMPETAIGYFPDAGSSYFLSKLKGNIGLFLSLTGYRLRGADIWYAGLATHYITSDKLESLTQKLLNSSSDNFQQILDEHQSKIDQKFSLEPFLEEINECFGKSSMSDIIHCLKNSKSDWSQKVLNQLNKMSPTSLCITFAAFNEAKFKNLEECLDTDCRLANSCLRRGTDFCEGVRAILIDKDGKPKWNPKHVDDVTGEHVKSFFTSKQDEDLQSVKKSNL